MGEPPKDKFSVPSFEELAVAQLEMRQQVKPHEPSGLPLRLEEGKLKIEDGAMTNSEAQEKAESFLNQAITQLKSVWRPTEEQRAKEAWPRPYPEMEVYNRMVYWGWQNKEPGFDDLVEISKPPEPARQARVEKVLNGLGFGFFEGEKLEKAGRTLVTNFGLATAKKALGLAFPQTVGHWEKGSSPKAS